MCLKNPWCTLLTREAPSSIWSTFLRLKHPTIKSGAHLHTEEPPEVHSMYVKDLRAYEAPFYPWRTLRFFEWPQGSQKDHLGPLFYRVRHKQYGFMCNASSTSHLEDQETEIVFPSSIPAHQPLLAYNIIVRCLHTENLHASASVL